jgi:hypothetical protein
MSDAMEDRDRNFRELRRDIADYVNGCVATSRTPSGSHFTVVYPRWSGLGVDGMLSNAQRELRMAAVRSMIGYTDPLLDEVE